MVVVLDPGMAFGTGHHETTRMCLALLDERLQAGPAPRVLDLGTGSGILAIEAARLGAKRVVAADTDPTARTTAEENVRANAVSTTVAIVDGDAWLRMGPYDLVTANLTAEDLRDLMPRVAASLAPSGAAILSGILASREPIVTQALSAQGLVVTTRREAGEWLALVVARTGRASVDFPGSA
jgi:ribosomal protein L11 methyltransferase